MSISVKRRLTILVAPLLLVAVVVGGCAGAPVQEMSNARQALKAAADSGAMTSASIPYRQAEELLKSAESELERHNYRSARDDANRAKELAIQAMEASITADHPRDD